MLINSYQLPIQEKLLREISKGCKEGEVMIEVKSEGRVGINPEEKGSEVYVCFSFELERW